MNADDLAKILDELGQRLGPSGEYVFKSAVKQAYINGWSILIGISILLFLGTVFSAFGWQRLNGIFQAKLNKWEESDKYRDRPILENVSSFAWVFVTGGIGFLCIALIVLVLGFGTMANDLLNPEYQALSDIISKIKQ